MWTKDTKDTRSWSCGQKDMRGTRMRATKYVQGKSTQIAHKIIIISEPNVSIRLHYNEVRH
jgi:hypothetical protein